MTYHLATYQSDRGPRAALVSEGRLYDWADETGRTENASVLSVLGNWSESRLALASLAAGSKKGPGLDIASAKLLSPVPNPGAIFCAGANFLDHCANMARAHGVPVPENPKTLGAPPFHFLKASRCAVGHDEPVQAISPALDYEAELAVVIGREGRNIAIENALDHVAGCMVANDLSARDIGFRRPLPREDAFFHSWFAHKSFESSAPMGPWITPIDQLPDWRELRLQTRVNGELRQDGVCAPMWYTIEDQIAYLSTIITLKPGDIILTGTPAGAGAETGRFLKPGDVVEVSVEGIGAVSTPII